jgi:ATP phosphoribosyltransferase
MNLRGMADICVCGEGLLGESGVEVKEEVKRRED